MVTPQLAFLNYHTMLLQQFQADTMSTNPADEVAARKRREREKNPIHIEQLDASVMAGASRVRQCIESSLKLKTVSSATEGYGHTIDQTVR